MIEGPFVVKRFAHVKRRMLVVAVAALLPAALGLSSTRGAAAQGFAAPHERFFRLEWEAVQRAERRVTIAGYIYNHYLYAVRRVQLHVEVFDGSDQQKGEAFGWVLGDVPPGGRAYFEIPIRSTVRPTESRCTRSSSAHGKACSQRVTLPVTK